FPAMVPIHIPLIVIFGPIFIGPLYGTASWGIISGNGKTDRRTVSQFHFPLYQALAKGTATNYGSHIIVLERPRNDFAGGSGTFVDKHIDRFFFKIPPIRSKVFVDLSTFVLGKQNEFSFF